MSNMNLFTWIRDGVRQSVLLGVSDAVEQLGTPAAAEDLHPSVAGFMNLERNQEAPRVGNSRGTGTRGKRLGKSLKDIGSGAES